MKLRLAAVLGGGVALVLGLAPVAQASTPANIACGQTITQSITLNKDLTCVGAAFSTASTSPIVVDLGGHVVRTTGGSGPESFTILAGGQVTIQNGRVVGRGLTDQYGGDGATFQNLVLDGSSILTINDTSPVIRHNQFVNGGYVYSSANTVDIESNTFVNGPASVTAMQLDATFATVLNNTVTGYDAGVVSTGSLASANIRGNHISYSGTGIRIGGSAFDEVPGVVSRNTVFSNRGDGIFLGDGSGQPDPNQSAGLLVSGNVVYGNGGNGIRVNPVSTPNTANYLDEHVNVILTGNRSSANAELGILSPGTLPPTPTVSVIVVDGGGNTARRNGNPAQCTHVVCSP